MAGVVFLDKLDGVVAAALSGTTKGGASDLTVTFTTAAACTAAVANLTSVAATIIIDTEKFMGAKPNMVNGYHVPGQLAEKVCLLLRALPGSCRGCMQQDLTAGQLLEQNVPCIHQFTANTYSCIILCPLTLCCRCHRSHRGHHYLLLLASAAGPQGRVGKMHRRFPSIHHRPHSVG